MPAITMRSLAPNARALKIKGAAPAATAVRARNERRVIPKVFDITTFLSTFNSGNILIAGFGDLCYKLPIDGASEHAFLAIFLW
jgi:hypothetical protein